MYVFLLDRRSMSSPTPRRFGFSDLRAVQAKCPKDSVELDEAIE